MACLSHSTFYTINVQKLGTGTRVDDSNRSVPSRVSNIYKYTFLYETQFVPVLTVQYMNIPSLVEHHGNLVHECFWFDLSILLKLVEVEFIS